MISYRYNKGVTLLELLAVILIIGILAAIAIPSYSGYMVRARRSDAKVVLEQVRAAQEMWRAERGCYAQDGVNCAGAALAGTAEVKLQNTMGVPTPPVGDYNWNFTVKNATTFTAQAVPNTARQAGDGTLTIDQNGNKLPADKWAK
jgi:type IV pilus assembly protein PilE